MTDVVHFVHNLNDRTIAAVARCLVRETQEQGRSVVLVAGSVAAGADHPEGVQVIDLGGSGRKTLPTLRALSRVLRRMAPQVVFAHAEGPARAAVLATRSMRNRPVVVGVVHNHHSSYPWSYPRIRRVVDGQLLPRLDALVGVSPGVATDLATTFPALADRVHMIPAPLTRWAELEDLAAESLYHPWFDDARPVVVTVGHVHPRKDHETLLRAVVSLRAWGREVLVMIVGSADGEHAAGIRRLVVQLGLQDHVALMGAITNPMPHIAAADVFVLSSRNEGLGIVLLEAMGVGTPIVSTDAPAGPRWVLQDGRAGLLTPVGDAEALATGIERVLGDAALRDRLTTVGRDRAEAFSPARITGQHLALAERLR
ncbi:N/A [soil metagenome]